MEIGLNNAWVNIIGNSDWYLAFSCPECGVYQFSGSYRLNKGLEEVNVIKITLTHIYLTHRCFNCTGEYLIGAHIRECREIIRIGPL